MGLRLTSDPVTLSEAKAFIGVTEGAEDDVISDLIGAATEHVQAVIGRQLKPATYKLSLRSFPLATPRA